MPDQMSYEVMESRGVAGEWRVEAINFAGDGEVYVTIFAGPDAQARAIEYATWKNGASTGLKLAQA
jgi:hypothetical protein